MPTKSGPNVRQRRIARRLRAWRSRAGMTLDEITPSLNWSKAKLSKFERAEVNAGPAEIIALATMYRVVSDAERDETVNLAIKSMSDPGWWANYAPDVVPNFFADYLETEAEAIKLRSVNEVLVDGLLQTSPYTEAVVRTWVDEGHHDVISGRSRVRQQRQNRLDIGADSPLSLHAVIHEAALRIPIGGGEVMGQQLDYLVERAKQDNITVQVVPFSLGAYPRMGNTFTLLDLDGDDAAAVYLENLNDGLLVEDPADIAAYAENFEGITNVALDPEASIQLITETREAGWAT